MIIFPEIKLNFEGVLWCTFLLVFLIQLIFIFVFPLRLMFHKRKRINTGKLPSVSIVICARNEEDNLYKNLPIILNQKYKNFEVIVVNDQSQDGSKHIVKAYQKEFPFLRLIELEKNKHRVFGKKIPLTVGIKGVKNDFIIVTDADCTPDSDQWISKMVENYTEKKEIVLGYSPYKKGKGFLNKLIRFDTTMIGINYLSMAKSGVPYMGVGRNMGYSKEVFQKADGFKKHYHIASGDDDLFIRDAGNRKNVAIEISPESFVYSEPKKTWESWINQKKRHFTTASEYRLINKLLLGIFPFTTYILIISFVTLLFNTEAWVLLLIIFLFRFLLNSIVHGVLFKKLKTNELIGWFVIFEIIHIVFMPFLYYSNSRIDKKKW